MSRYCLRRQLHERPDQQNPLPGQEPVAVVVTAAGVCTFHLALPPFALHHSRPLDDGSRQFRATVADPYVSVACVKGMFGMLLVSDAEHDHIPVDG